MVTRNLSVSGPEASDDFCVKLSDLKCAEESYLNDEDRCSQESSSPEVCQQKNSSDDTMHTVSGLYAGVLIAIVVATMFSEINYKSVPEFFIHDYLFIYFLIVGILLILGGVFIKYRYQAVPFHNNSEGEVKIPNRQTKDQEEIDINILVKVGTAISGFVVVFASVLEVASILSSETCLSYGSAFHPILRSVFILVQIYFLKGSVEILNAFGCIRNLAIMHFFTSNVALWIRNLLWEIAKEWDGAEHLKRNPSIDIHNSNLSFAVHSLESDPNSLNVSLHFPRHVVHYTTVCYFQVQNPQKMDMTSLQYCLQTSSVGLLWAKANQYLYPLMAQYYFLISYCLYIMWKKNNCKKGKPNYLSYCPKNLDKNMNLTCSTKGLFLGSIVLSASIIILIISFTVKKDLSLMLHSIYCVNFVLTSFSAIVGLFQIKSMYSWKSNKDIKFIRVFQKLGLTAVFMYGSCNVISGSLSYDKVRFIACLEAVSMILQGVTQYLLIVQASKKKMDVSNVQQKPGCQSVVFLMLCNVSLWMLDCFVTWNHMHKYPETIFSAYLLSVISRFVFPLVVFYRFHSFVSLLNIWRNTYK